MCARRWFCDNHDIASKPAWHRPARRFMTRRYQISVILTDECNMRCRYCTTAKRPVEISDHVLDRLALLLDDTGSSDLDINFHGGEPTLVWESGVLGLDARLCALEARAPGTRRITRSICTNGTLITAERAAFLATHRFNVRLSVDGRRRSHTLYRLPAGGRQAVATQDLYGAAIEALGLLIAAGAKTAANMVVTPATVGELVANAVFLLRQGLVHLVISPVVGMRWDDEHLLALDRGLLGMHEVWRLWIERHPPHAHEDLRRSLLSEIDRAAYCIGERMNQPDATVLVIGPDGRIFGDEPEARTETALHIGHVDSIQRFDELPKLARTAFQLMYDREFHPPEVLRDVQRTHRLLRLRLREVYVDLFGPLPDAARAAEPVSTPAQ
jgi:sulfatase maturation enzyme AslB (radical SAM superfamily)